MANLGGRKPSFFKLTIGMKMNRLLLEMLYLQGEVNKEKNYNWREKSYPWHIGIAAELGKVLAELPWKWWVKRESDQEKILFGVVDIWHFGMSALLQEKMPPTQIVDKIIDSLHAKNKPIRSPVAAIIEALIHTCSTESFSIPLFCDILRSLDISVEDLYSRYVGKNALNTLRQVNGFNQGDYREKWGIHSDNHHLTEILLSVGVETNNFRQMIYDLLSERYEIHCPVEMV